MIQERKPRWFPFTLSFLPKVPVTIHFLSERPPEKGNLVCCGKRPKTLFLVNRKPLRPFNKKSPEAAGENSLFVILGTGIDGAGTVDLLTQQHTGKLVRKGEAGEADPACGGRLDLWG